ncbi:nitrite/sulfite reductase, partial [Pseudomonas sp. CrR25]|nr:nitrite/sulfite reductase [Pseudomonas sp. CrR25]
LAEILRQWSTINPEFLFLPRKFKIALCAAQEDRAAIQVHDIGLQLYRDASGELLLRVLVGGGLGRTPIIAQEIRDGLPWPHLLSYVEAILRVYNRHGRRDNQYKARLKILVKALGIAAFAAEVEREWLQIKDGPAQLSDGEYRRVAASFHRPSYAQLSDVDLEHATCLARDAAFGRWVARNVRPHQVPGYASVLLSTKPGQ